MRGTRSRISAFDSTVVFMRITPPLSTVITSGLLSLGTGSAFSSFLGGRFSQNVFVIIGVTSMKMIRTTRTTSTSGVMLMAGVDVVFFFPPPPIDIPMVLVSRLSAVSAGVAGLFCGDFEQNALEADILQVAEGVAHLAPLHALVALQHQRTRGVFLMQLDERGFEISQGD